MNDLISTDNKIAKSTLDLGNLSERWIRYLDVEPISVVAYNKAINQFVRFMAEAGVSKPTREDILIYKDYLVGSEHKPTTIQLYMQAVKLFFQWTELEGIYPNIAKHIKGAKLDHAHKKDDLSSSQANTLVSGIDTATLAGKRDYAIIALMLTSGLRTIEVQRANIEDLRLLGDFTALYIQGKGHVEKTDYVKVVKEVEQAIKSYLEARRKEEGALKASAPLFASVSNRNFGGRMTTKSISRLAKNHLIESGFDSPRLTAHSLRHTAATINLLSGASVEETQQLLRHTNINTTMIYSHALERAKNQSESRIASAIFKKDEEKQ